MLSAILGFLGSVVSALPKLIEAVRNWKKDQAIADEQAAKDNRNAAAIRDACNQALPPGPPLPPR